MSTYSGQLLLVLHFLVQYSFHTRRSARFCFMPRCPYFLNQGYSTGKKTDTASSATKVTVIAYANFSVLCSDEERTVYPLVHRRYYRTPSTSGRQKQYANCTKFRAHFLEIQTNKAEIHIAGRSASSTSLSTNFRFMTCRAFRVLKFFFAFWNSVADERTLRRALGSGRKRSVRRNKEGGDHIRRQRFTLYQLDAWFHFKILQFCTESSMGSKATNP